MKQTRRKWRWVTSDQSEHGAKYIDIWQEEAKPTIHGAIWTQSDEYKPNNSICVCRKVFEQITGIIVPNDQPIKVKFSAKVV
jgi:hypothetical protein